MSELKIGDCAFHARVGMQHITKTCPVCFGNRRVMVTLGDGSAVSTACDCCGAGFEGPLGVVQSYEYAAKPTPVVVRGMRIEERDGKRKVEYEIDDHWHVPPGDLYANESVCRARCEAMAASENDREDARLRAKRDGTLKKASWLVGYHRSEAKRCREKAEYHEARAALVKARAASPDTAGGTNR